MFWYYAERSTKVFKCWMQNQSKYTYFAFCRRLWRLSPAFCQQSKLWIRTDSVQHTPGLLKRELSEGMEKKIYIYFKVCPLGFYNVSLPFVVSLGWLPTELQAGDGPGTQRNVKRQHSSYEILSWPSLMTDWIICTTLKTKIQYCIDPGSLLVFFIVHHWWHFLRFLLWIKRMSALIFWKKNHPDFKTQGGP